jgi:hypothetical protein
MISSLKAFKKKSFAVQLQAELGFMILFVFSVFILVFLLASYYLENHITTEWEKTQHSTFISQLNQLGTEKILFIINELDSFINYTISLNAISTELIVHGAFFKYNRPVNYLSLNDSEVLYNTGCYQTKYLYLSSHGEVFMAKAAAIDVIFPIYYRSDVVRIYNGYEVDEITHYYPCYYESNKYQTPIVKEWYYKAVNWTGEIVITEPYVDTHSGRVILTISKTISELDGPEFGVTAVDIPVQDLAASVSNFKISGGGFAILVSSTGMLFNVPDIWSPDQNPYLKIFDAAVTNISLLQWQNLINAPSSQLESFCIGINYLVSVQSFAINPGPTELLLYLLIFIPESEVTDSLTYLQDQFWDIRISTIIITFTIQVGVYIAYFIGTCVFGNGLDKDFNELKIFLQTFVMMSLRMKKFNKSTSAVLRDDGLFGIYKAVNTRTAEIRAKEARSFEVFTDRVRPYDEFLYNEWMNKLYPHNEYNEVQLEWRKSLPNLN